MKIEKTKTGYEVYLMVSEITKSYLIWHDADMNPYMMSELDNKAKQVKEQKRGQIPIKGYVKMHIVLNKKEFDEALGYTDAPRYFVVV